MKPLPVSVITRGRTYARYVMRSAWIAAAQGILDCEEATDANITLDANLPLADKYSTFAVEQFELKPGDARSA